MICDICNVSVDDGGEVGGRQVKNDIRHYFAYQNGKGLPQNH